ncbi:MAG: DUF4124 domain-containing protein, partial [Usitatibacter sp.]
MKKGIIGMCMGAALVCFSGAAGAEMFKCVKDGKTSFQEQPCGGQGGAETKLQSSKPSAWIGCYLSTGQGFESGTRSENFEVRQEGDTLYMPVGMEGKQETRLIMKVASENDLRAFKEKVLGPDFKGEVSSGLAVYGAAIGTEVKSSSDDRGIRMGLYRVHPVGEEQGLYFFAPFAFDKTK